MEKDVIKLVRGSEKPALRMSAIRQDAFDLVKQTSKEAHVPMVELLSLYVKHGVKHTVIVDDDE